MTAADPFLLLSLLGRSLSVLRLLVGIGSLGPFSFQEPPAALATNHIVQAVLHLVHLPAVQGS